MTRPDLVLHSPIQSRLSSPVNSEANFIGVDGTPFYGIELIESPSRRSKIVRRVAAIGIPLAALGACVGTVAYGVSEHYGNVTACAASPGLDYPTTPESNGAYANIAPSVTCPN
jgi:hypothetical protein